MDEKKLKVNAGKMKIIICGMGLDFLQSYASFNVPSVAIKWAVTASSATAARRIVHILSPETDNCPS